MLIIMNLEDEYMNLEDGYMKEKIRMSIQYDRHIYTIV